MDGGVVWRSALIQLASVAALSLALGAALPHDFFEDWGWLAGPLSWLACAALTATVLSLPRPAVLAGALLAGVPSAIAVLAGVHWLGVAIAIAIFAAWCGRLATRTGEPSWT